MHNYPHKEEDNDSDDFTALEGSDGHIPTAHEDLINYPLQQITTANKLFDANPFKRIAKETDKFIWAPNCKKQTKKLDGGPCIGDVTQDDIVSCQALILQAHYVGRCFNFRDKTFRDCVCAKNLIEDDIWDVAIFLVNLANKDKALGNTQLKGFIDAANQNHVTTVQLRRKLWQTAAALHLILIRKESFLTTSSLLAQNQLSVGTSFSFSFA
jgi:hypothetical protein